MGRVRFGEHSGPTRLTLAVHTATRRVSLNAAVESYRVGMVKQEWSPAPGVDQPEHSVGKWIVFEPMRIVKG
jgi:hypothetical protein